MIGSGVYAVYSMLRHPLDGMLASMVNVLKTSVMVLAVRHVLPMTRV